MSSHDPESMGIVDGRTGGRIGQVLEVNVSEYVLSQSKSIVYIFALESETFHALGDSQENEGVKPPCASVAAWY